MTTKTDRADALRKLRWMERNFDVIGNLFRYPADGGEYEAHEIWAVQRALAWLGIELDDSGNCRWKDFRGCNHQYAEPWIAP
jgi:hypothetical protein